LYGFRPVSERLSTDFSNFCIISLRHQLQISPFSFRLVKKVFLVFAMNNYLFNGNIALEEKNKHTSERYRNAGNKFYVQMRLYDAIFEYNHAIAFAETGSLDLALAYGNRSAAYFVAGKYAECLKSIELARESDYPASKMEKLDERQQKCEQFMEIEEEQVPDPENDLWHYIKLSYPANEKIPWMIEGLEMRTTEKYGRGIYAKHDLKAGDIICIEESKLHLQDSQDIFKCCDNCSKSNMMNLIPCLKTGKF
jgi:tetratricopeptide (TPR) repeat protein